MINPGIITLLDYIYCGIFWLNRIFTTTRLYNPLNLLRRGVWSCLVIVKCQIKCMLYDDFTFVICSKWYADFGLLENVILPRYILLVIKSRTADRKSICSCQWKLDFFFCSSAHKFRLVTLSGFQINFLIDLCNISYISVRDLTTAEQKIDRHWDPVVPRWAVTNLTVTDVILSMILNSENSINYYHSGADPGISKRGELNTMKIYKNNSHFIFQTGGGARSWIRLCHLYLRHLQFLYPVLYRKCILF